MNEQLIKFIELCLMDGVITEKEREVIFRKSQELEVPDDECEIILEGMIQKSEMVREIKSKDSIPKNTLEKHKKSNSFIPKQVPKSVLINLKNSEKLKEEIKILKNKNDNLIDENKLLSEEISNNISLIKDNSLIYINSLKVNDELFHGFIVCDIIEDMDEVDLYKTDEGTVTWGSKKESTKQIEPVLPHPLFVIYNYVETSVLKRYNITYGVNKGKYVEKGGILKTKLFSSEKTFFYNKEEKRQSIIPEKYKGVNPLKIVITEKGKNKLVFLIYNDDFIVIELKYSVSFENSDLNTWKDLGGMMISYGEKYNTDFWYSITRVEHLIHSNLLKILNV